MTELFTTGRVEDAIASTADFMQAQRSSMIDGGYAGQSVATRVQSVKHRATNLLQAIPHPKFEGLYVPLSKYNAADYNDVAATLPGYLVLVPSTMVETSGESRFYPAVVSELGLIRGELRLHVLKQPYRQQISHGSKLLLSAAGQSETNGVGSETSRSGDGVEAEHFATVLSVASDPSMPERWKRGEHPNHSAWKTANSSVTSEVSNRLFGGEVDQQTVAVTRQQITSGVAMLLWHAGLVDSVGVPETATASNALVIYQSLGFEALKAANNGNLDSLKRIIA